AQMVLCSSPVGGRRTIAPWAGVLILSACSGEIGGPAGGDGPNGGISKDGTQTPLSCDLGIPQAGETRIHRLTPRQFTNTLRDLFEDDSLSFDLDADKEVHAAELTVRKYHAA